MPSPPQLRMDLATFAMMALHVSLYRTSPNCSRSTWCAVTTLLRSQGTILSTYCRSRTFVRGRHNIVASGRQVFPLIGVADLEPGDLLGVADAPLLLIPLSALQQRTQAAGAHPGQASHSQVSVVASSTDAEGIAPAVPPPSPTLMECLNPAQRSAFRRVWARLPPHLREIAFDLHASGWDPPAIEHLEDVLWDSPDRSPPRRRSLGPAP